MMDTQKIITGRHSSDPPENEWAGGRPPPGRDQRQCEAGTLQDRTYRTVPEWASVRVGRAARDLLAVAGTPLPADRLETALIYHNVAQAEVPLAIDAALAEAELCARRSKRDLAQHRLAAIRLRKFRAARLGIGRVA